MSKKKIKEHDLDNDDISENEMDNEVVEDYVPETEESQSDESNIEITLSDEEENLDIIIEISDDSDSDSVADIKNIVSEEETPIAEGDEIIEGEDPDIILSKHKLQGKHSLKYDSIFKGKKEEKTEEGEIDASFMYFNDKFEVDRSSPFYLESHDTEQYVRAKLVKERVYKILIDNTTINFLNNRRKPSRVDFNNYYHLLKSNLIDDNFTNIEIFNELAVYFSDNLFNMFKLLDNKWRNMIINELQDHIGKTVNSKDVRNRNVYIGTELEFEWEDEESLKIITGVVVECDYNNSIFTIDSYENIYEVDITQVTKILNNEKFKYNLNKLNNIDFL